MTDLEVIGIGAVAGAAFGWLHTRGSFPGVYQIGTTLKEPTTWAVIAGYYILGFYLLWRFLKPSDEKGILAWLGAGVFWNTF